MKYTTRAKVVSAALKSTLKHLRNESTLREAANTDEQPIKIGDSLDAQVDKYFIEYEKEAKNAKNEGVDIRMITRRFLTEAEGAQLPASAEDDKDLGAKKIDVESFTTSVVRLVENYDSLLEVRSTLIRRAINFLAGTYDAEVVKQFEQTLREEHGMVAGESKRDVNAEESTPPPGDHAGPEVGGGG